VAPKPKNRLRRRGIDAKGRSEGNGQFVTLAGWLAQAILKYVDEDARAHYRAKLEPLGDQVREEVERLLEEAWS